jgi:methylenetetrahydrofolate reductase (NADPH)
MAEEHVELKERIDAGKSILLAELTPPRGGDAAPFRATVKPFAGKVHALGISDNRDGVAMSAVAAASVAAREGVEPILHMVTRDRNRIALISDYLGARALGIRNVLCTTGTHQTLGAFRSAKNVFDLDSIQLLSAVAGLGEDGSVVGEDAFAAANGCCLGATAAPDADPLPLQLVRLAKKVQAGARFVITEPVFDVERFDAWWGEVTQRGLHEKVAIVAGIRPLLDAEAARAYAAKRPRPRIPAAILDRVASGADATAQRAAGMAIALETAKHLHDLTGLRGLEIHADGTGDAALELMEQAGLTTE